MTKSIQVLVVKDEEGELRPIAGIWKDNEHGRAGSENYLSKNPWAKIVEATLTELKDN